MSTRREFITQTAVATLMAAAATQAAGAGGPAVPAEPPTASNGHLKTGRIPHTDLVVSRLAFGCAMLGLDWDSPEFVSKTVPVIETAYEQGITLFDTADIYGFGKAEIALGQVLKESPGMRSKIVIQSKCGDQRYFFGNGAIDNSRDHILAAVDASLERLGTGHLDILLLHWPDSLVQPEGVASAFDDLHKSARFATSASAITILISWSFYRDTSDSPW